MQGFAPMVYSPPPFQNASMQQGGMQQSMPNGAGMGMNGGMGVNGGMGLNGGPGMNGGAAMNGGMGGIMGGLGNSGFRDFGKGKGKGKGGGKGGKGKGRGGKGNQRYQAPAVPLFEEGTRIEEITATSFEELGVHPMLCEILARNGFAAPFPIQSLCIPEALAGRDVCGKAKTGSGKTLAFGLPLIQMLQPTREKGFPSALILVPTRELALQVHQVLSNIRGPLNIEVAYGGSENRKFQVNTLLRKPVDILAACPGRLLDFCEAGIISLSKISHLVLDEADRMAEMGFQEQVDDILRRIGDDRPRQTMLFSATLDSSVDQLVKRHMNQPVHHQVAEKSVTVDQMAHRFIQVGHGRDKMPVCAALCCLPGLEKVLVFVRTKLGVDDLTAALKHNYRIRALAIHGDKTQTARERTLQAFDKGDLHVLVATDVAARGLDIKRVDFVINYDAPEGVDGHKIYLHRSGRTARAGKSGLVATLAARGDQEQDMDAIRRRLNIRDPVHRVTPRDAGNLTEILNLEEFLVEFNEGRYLDPRIEASRQRILRDIEEGGPMQTATVGLGGYSAESGRGKGKGGKGKGAQGGYNAYAQQQHVPAYNGFRDARQEYGAFGTNGMQEYNQSNSMAQSNGMAQSNAMNMGGNSQDHGTSGGNTGKGNFSYNAGMNPSFASFSASGRGAQPGPSVGSPYGNLDANNATQATFGQQSYGNNFAGAMQPQVGGLGAPLGSRGSFGTQPPPSSNGSYHSPALGGPAYGNTTSVQAPHPPAAGPSFGTAAQTPSFGGNASAYLMGNAISYGASGPGMAPASKGYPVANISLGVPTGHVAGVPGY